MLCLYLLGELGEDAGQYSQQFARAPVCSQGHSQVVSHQVGVNPQQRLQTHQHAARPVHLLETHNGDKRHIKNRATRILILLNITHNINYILIVNIMSLKKTLSFYATNE